MLRSLLAVALACAATPAAAAQILYATAAIPNRVEGFCLGTNGGMELRPVIQQDTVDNPRRLLLPPQPDGSPGDVLYVAGRHRVESFLIRVNGGLESIGATRSINGANPFDIAVNAARTRLYVPRRSHNRIEAYPLDPVTGAILGGDMTSCAVLRPDVNLQDVEVGMAAGGEALYVTASTSAFVTGKKGRVDVFAITDGELPDRYDEFADPQGAVRCGNPDATTTTTSTSTSSTTLTTTVTSTSTTTTVDTRFTEPLSTRKKLRGPGPFVLAEPFLYVFDLFSRRIIQFELTDGLFTDDEQPRVTATDEVGRFLDLIRAQSTLLGAADIQGRVRAFRLKADDDGLPTTLPRQPQRQTNQIIDSTPVRITVGTSDGGGQVLYVPGGESNRVHAYRMIDGSRGLSPEAKGFSATERRQGTFPNDAVVAQIAGTCP
jgi:hypothetical protein